MTIITSLDHAVILSGELQEGNICYLHHHLQGTWWPGLSTKRSHWQKLCRSVSTVVEVGVNAGHSAALALEANNTVVYWGIDPGDHSYTAQCCHILQQQFHDRFRWFKGRSQEIWPNLSRPLDRTLWSIDGEHTPEAAELDLKSVERLSRQGDLLWFDDAEAPEIKLCPQVLTSDLWQENTIDAQCRWRTWERL